MKSRDSGYDQQKSRDNVQSLVARIHEKSKALFQTDIEYTEKSKPTQSTLRTVKVTKSKPTNHDQIVHDNAMTNFDDQPQTTWSKTQLRLKKIERMNAHFQRNNVESHELKEKYERTSQPLMVSVGKS